MATPIRLTEKIKEELLEEVKKSLEAALLVNGKVSIEQAYTYKNKKAKLIFTPSAALKMFLLVNDASEEIGWHGLVERIDDVTWKITDILIYPQTVTFVTVSTDQEEYQDWQDSLADEEINALRYHGHSHVRMGVTPSQTDLDHQQQILESIRYQKQGYYIFQIINKDWKTNLWIYDMAHNVKYETEDIELEWEGVDIAALKTSVEKLVKKEKMVTTYGATGAKAVTQTTAKSGKNSVKASSKSKGSGKVTTQPAYEPYYIDLDDDDEYYQRYAGAYGHYGWYY